MKARVIAVMCVTVCLFMSACTAETKVNEFTENTAIKEQSFPESAEKLESLLLHPMSEVYEEMGWKQEQLEIVQVSHLKVDIDPIVFHNESMQLFITPTTLLTEDVREQYTKEGYDFSSVPVPKDADEVYLQRFAYVSFFEGSKARQEACSYMKVLDDHFVALYGSADSTAIHAFGRYEADEYFAEAEKDTINPDQHFLSDTWIIKEEPGLKYYMILSIVEYEGETGASVYRVAISYEWSLER